MNLLIDLVYSETGKGGQIFYVGYLLHGNGLQLVLESFGIDTKLEI